MAGIIAGLVAGILAGFVPALRAVGIAIASVMPRLIVHLLRTLTGVV